MKKFLFIILILGAIPTFAQKDLTRILFILDASNSMNKKWAEESKMITAKRILSNAIDSLEGIPNLRIALRTYGAHYPVTPTYKNCNDTKLEVPFAPNNIQKILDKLKTIHATGTTPIALSLGAAAGDFPDTNAKNIIVLITDGLEECGGDPCTIAKKLHDKGITISPFIIGLGLDMSYLSHFKCYGNYKSAQNPLSFKKVLKNIVDKILVNTTVQINLNDIHGNPIETNVTMFLYKAGTHDLKYTFTHTLNRYGLPDTVILDPSINYDLLVKTVPPVRKDNINIIRNIHNVIEVNTPQGELEVKFDRPTRHNFVEVRVMESGDSKTLYVQNFGELQKYIVGEYDLEILTLPRRYKTIKISQSATNTVTLSAPGVTIFKSYKPVTGQIFEIKENNKFEWVCDLNDTQNTNKFILQPGRYKIAYRRKDYTEISYSREINFKVFSNKKQIIHL